VRVHEPPTATTVVPPQLTTIRTYPTSCVVATKRAHNAATPVVNLSTTLGSQAAK
jgi:hypothetical protein